MKTKWKNYLDKPIRKAGRLAQGNKANKRRVRLYGDSELVRTAKSVDARLAFID
jgi:hypothetical protein